AGAAVARALACRFSEVFAGRSAAAASTVAEMCRSWMGVLALVGGFSYSGEGGGLAERTLASSLCRLRFSGIGGAAIAACASWLDGAVGRCNPVLFASCRGRSSGRAGGGAVVDLGSI